MESSRLTAIAFASAFSVFAVFTSAFVQAQPTHTWGSYHWARTNDPFTLQVIDSTSNNWFVEMDMSLTKWSDSQALDLVVTQTDNSDQARNLCGMSAGKIRACNYNYGATGWLGLASIGVTSGGHIDRGTAKVNDYYSSYWGSQSLKNHVMCQEIGHLFGVGHTSTDGSSQQTCMDYSSSQYSQWPNAADYDLLDYVIYDHFDSFNSYDDSLDGGGSDGGTGGTDGGTGGTDGGTGGTDGGSGGKKGKGGSGDGTKPCNGRKCTGFTDDLRGQHIPPRAVRIQQTANHEIWVSPRSGGGMWIHHVRLVDELLDHGDDHTH